MGLTDEHSIQYDSGMTKDSYKEDLRSDKE